MDVAEDDEEEEVAAMDTDAEEDEDDEADEDEDEEELDEDDMLMLGDDASGDELEDEESGDEVRFCFTFSSAQADCSCCSDHHATPSKEEQEERSNDVRVCKCALVGDQGRLQLDGRRCQYRQCRRRDRG